MVRADPRASRNGYSKLSHDPRVNLTPQMLAYDDFFSDNGVIRWLPYVMYFQPPDHRSSVVNTDSRGFRFSTSDGEPISVDDAERRGTVDIVAGSSTVFGIGTSSDVATLPSRLNLHQRAGSDPWINMGGRSHNSAQELILHVLLRHHLPKVGRIVLLSGFNDLGLARLPAPLRFESGSFFSSPMFFDRLDGPPPDRRRSRHRPGAGETANTEPDRRPGPVRRRPTAPVRGRSGPPPPRRLAGARRRRRHRAHVRAATAGRLGARTGLPGGGDPVRPPGAAWPVRRDVRRHPGPRRRAGVRRTASATAASGWASASPT